MKTQLQDMDVKFISNSNNQNPGGTFHLKKKKKKKGITIFAVNLVYDIRKLRRIIMSSCKIKNLPSVT